MKLLLEVMERLNIAMGINIFGIKENEFALKLEGKDCICSHCPKELYLNCVSNWKLGNGSGVKFEEPYFYFCPLNLAVGIVPVSLLDKAGGVDYFCIGPLLIKDLDIKKQYIPKNLENLLMGVYIPKQMKVFGKSLFENYVWISYLSLLGASQRNSVLTEWDIDRNKEVYYQENDSRIGEEKSVSFLENAILNKLEVGNSVGIVEDLNDLIRNLNKEKGMINRLIQIYYVFINKGIELGVHKEYAQQLNNDFLNKVTTNNNHEEIMNGWIKGVLSLVAMIDDFNRKQNLWVLKTKKYIESHYKEALTLKDVAKALNINYNYLSNLFNQEMTISFSDYLHKYRIKEGKRLLIQSNLDLATISMELGFSSQSYFSKVFKKTVGSTPGDFKHQYNKKQLKKES